ncbi:glycosyl transferase [Rhodococcoides trifolii]|uniref:Glycosyl transferase n=1 Tax=Rhodococcoides trifolii TaxID=908250 RepID=A0A917G519_9NOCA|nr:glycosyltransferase family A protein [Rhodococcus trifolii]GGG23298.1 glycosyl transferase [Rhodococcus trifolii]
MTRGRPRSVSVVIAAHNAAHTIGTQLTALAEQTYDGDVEILVCDNGSTDGLKTAVSGHPVRYVDASGRQGASFARNTGARIASGDFLAFCDADDAVHPDWLQELTAAARHHDVVSGALETRSLNSATVQRWRTMIDPDTPYEWWNYLPVVCGANFGVWRDAYTSVGGFDESYDRGAEDADLSFRLQLAGWTLTHAPRALVAYRLRDTEIGLWRQSVMCGEGDAMLYSDYRHYGMPRKPVIALIDVTLLVLLRNPLLPTFITRLSRGRWIFYAGNLLGRIKGSLKHRVFWV